MASTETHVSELFELIRKHTSPLAPFPTETAPDLIKLTSVKAILFDIYGTILISGTGDISIAMEKQNEFPISSILTGFGIKLLMDRESVDGQFAREINRLISEDHSRKKNRGIQFPEVEIREIWKEIIASLNRDLYIDGSMSDEQIEKAALTYECLINPVWPMPGLDSLLDFLYKSDKYILGIVSNAQFYTENILSALTDFKIAPGHFSEELIFYSFKENEAKPSKDFFQKAVSKLKTMYNIDPGEILYLGNDMLNDMYTASACGCKTALFAGDRRSLRLRKSDKRCRDLIPDITITHLDQLLNIL